MSDLFDTAPCRASSFTAAARELVPAVLGEEKITRTLLNAAMTAAFGGSDADGRWTQRESFEVLEHAVALAMRNRSAMRDQLAMGDVLQASALLARLPTQTVRSEEQIEWQQFSTPLDLSTVAVLLASPRGDDIVLEPSAGNGLLVAQLGPVGSLQLNEIDPSRRARLAATFPDTTVSGHDGATIASTMASLPRPSVVVMNPPFSRSVGRGDDDLAAVRHLQAAIRRVRPNGRVVAIMPDWFSNSARMGEIWNATLDQVTVRTSIRLTAAYGKHGTSVAVRLYVLDKAAGHRTGLELQDKDGVLKEDLPPIQRWLNRLLALPIGLQNLIFDEFLALVETRVAAARDAGTLDVGVETMQVDRATVLDDTILRTDPISGATSHLLTIEVARRRQPVSLDRVLRIADSDSTAMFLRNGRSDKVALRTAAHLAGTLKGGADVQSVQVDGEAGRGGCDVRHPPALRA